MRRTVTAADVIAIIAEETSISPERIQPQHSLNFDLGVDGDDAEELLRTYMEKFHVNMQAFDFHRYFGDERAFNIFAYLWQIFTGIEKQEPLFVRDLVRSAQLGHWAPHAKLSALENVADKGE